MCIHHKKPKWKGVEELRAGVYHTKDMALQHAQLDRATAVVEVLLTTTTAVCDGFCLRVEDSVNVCEANALEELEA